MKEMLTAKEAREISKNHQSFFKKRVFELIKDEIEHCAMQGFFMASISDQIGGMDDFVGLVSQEELESAFPGMKIEVSHFRTEKRLIGVGYVPAKIEISWAQEV